MNLDEMKARRAQQAARRARGEWTVEDVLGRDDFCLVRIEGTTTFACVDCELIVVRPSPHLSDDVHLIELTENQVQKVRAVLQRSGKWDSVHVLDGTLEELQREVGDYASMEKLESRLTVEQRAELRDMVEAAYRRNKDAVADYRSITLTEEESETAALALAFFIRNKLVFRSDRSEEEAAFLADCQGLLWRLDSDRAQQFVKALPGWERPAGAGLEHVPPDQLYSARTEQLQGRPRPGTMTCGRKVVLNRTESEAVAEALLYFVQLRLTGEICEEVARQAKECFALFTRIESRFGFGWLADTMARTAQRGRHRRP